MRANVMIWVVLAGCDAGAPKTDCVGAVSNVLGLADAKTDRANTQIKDALFRQCSDGGWSPKTADCLLGAETRDDVEECSRGRMTREQSAAFIAVAQPLLDAMTKGVIAKMEEFSDRMCGCKDAACAKSVNDDMTKWANAEMEKKHSQRPRLSVEQTKRVTEVGTRMGECMMKAMGMSEQRPVAPDQPTAGKR